MEINLSCTINEAYSLRLNTIMHTNFVCYIDVTMTRCGEGLKHLIESQSLQSYLGAPHQVVEKQIYIHGALRKVKN